VQLYSQRSMNAQRIASSIGITYPSVSSLAKDFEEISILKKVTGFKRNRLFVFSEYLNLFESQLRSKKDDLNCLRPQLRRLLLPGVLSIPP